MGVSYREHPIGMDDLGIPPFMETLIYIICNMLGVYVISLQIHACML